MTHANAKFVRKVATSDCKSIACQLGQYKIWQTNRGAEVWLHYPANNNLPLAHGRRPFHPIDDLKGLSVFHRGASEIVMQLTRSVHVSRSNNLDGVCHGELRAKTGKGLPVPFAFEHIGFGIDPVEEPCLAKVQIAGLAHKIWAFGSEADYLAAAPSRRLIGRGALMPVEPEEVKDVDLVYRTKEGALWYVTGLIRRSIRMTNPETGAPYVWMLVETDRGDFDILANPEKISGDISVGHTMVGVVSMAGRILERY